MKKEEKIFKRLNNGKSPVKEELDFLRERAQEVKARFKGNPEVIIVVAGEGRRDDDLEPGSCLIGHTFTKKTYRLRHVVGILQAAIQKESFFHFWKQLQSK